MAKTAHHTVQEHGEKEGRGCSQRSGKASTDVEAMHRAALAAWRDGYRQAALALLRRASALHPDRPDLINSLGVVLDGLGFHDEAEAVLANALRLAPHDPDIRCNLGLARYRKNNFASAQQCFEDVLSACPRHTASLANLGMTLLAKGEAHQASQVYERVVAQNNAKPYWWANLGTAYLGMGDLSRAAHALRKAVDNAPQNADCHYRLGVALNARKDFEGSITAFQKALDLIPDHAEAIAGLCIVLQQTCRWDLLPAFLHRLDQQTRRTLDSRRKPAEQPMFNIRRSSDTTLNLAVARAWSCAAQQQALLSANRFSQNRPLHANRRITLGYLSYDFRNHPVAHQILPLFGLHNRNRFRVLAFSMGPDDHSDFRACIEKDCDAFIEIGTLIPSDAAQVIHRYGTDILVDLMGHSHHNRMQIAALRPAPVQVSYLGFLGTTGADFFDYLVADNVVVPQSENCRYSEKLIRMPHCYQMNHKLFYPTAVRGFRSDWGLPSTGVVFCCFNAAYKINAALFETWIKILKQVEGSVLWLYNDNTAAAARLQKAARQAGIAPKRLIFAAHLPLQEHLQRLAHADLVLDTDIYNGGATTANALWSGVPVLTIMGRHWVSRMAASHLLAAGMDELITNDLEDYEAKAIDWGNHPEMLQRIRAKLNQRRMLAPMFDATRFVRDLEDAFETIWGRYCVGLPPDHINLRQDNSQPEWHSPDYFKCVETALSAESLFETAVLQQSNGEIEKAVATYKKALEVAPGLAEAAYNIGVICHQQQKWQEAQHYFSNALNLKPEFFDAVYNLAASLKASGQFREAIQTYEKALLLRPDFAQAYYHLALCRQKTGEHAKALDAFQRAIDLDAYNPLCWFNMAESVRKTRSLEHVLACYAKAVTLKPDWYLAHYNLAIALRLKKRLSEAIAHMQQVLHLKPDFGDARAYLFRLAQSACDWVLMEYAEKRLEPVTQSQLAAGLKTSESPMVNLRRQSDPQRNLAIARAWSKHMAAQMASQFEQPRFNHSRKAVGRLRIGYISNDFKDHAVAHQIRGVLAAHNRTEFEIFGYAANPDNGTRYRRLLFKACDHTREIHDLDPVQAARRIHQDGIHILVDLSGYSADSLLPIAALRPAPIQATYLGFLGSTGADFIDYIFADQVVVPSHHMVHYSEKVIHLPHCYQANDNRLSISNRLCRRNDFGLPNDAFVFCCFNQAYKIDSLLFRTWINILKAVENSVLWLLETNASVKNNLLAAARGFGVVPGRLVFSGFEPIEDNLARLRLADLALDTCRYNGGATTANALWVGLPVLTMPGNHWVSRMTASALCALDMPELIVDSLKAYEQKAINLALDPALLNGVRQKLIQRRLSAPLFDTALFTRHLEIAYQTMWRRFQDRQNPVSFKVNPLSRQFSVMKPACDNQAEQRSD